VLGLWDRATHWHHDPTSEAAAMIDRALVAAVVASKASESRLNFSARIGCRALMPLLGAGAAFAMLAGTAQTRQVLLPKPRAEVPRASL
jgi:hypothetical protein